MASNKRSTRKSTPEARRATLQRRQIRALKYGTSARKTR